MGCVAHGGEMRTCDTGTPFDIYAPGSDDLVLPSVCGSKAFACLASWAERTLSLRRRESFIMVLFGFWALPWLNRHGRGPGNRCPLSTSFHLEVCTISPFGPMSRFPTSGRVALAKGDATPGAQGVCPHSAGCRQAMHRGEFGIAIPQPVAIVGQNRKRRSEEIALLRQCFSTLLCRYEYLTLHSEDADGQRSCQAIQVLDVERRNIIVRPFLDADDEAGPRAFTRSASKHGAVGAPQGSKARCRPS